MRRDKALIAMMAFATALCGFAAWSLIDYPAKGVRAQYAPTAAGVMIGIGVLCLGCTVWAWRES